MPRKPPLRPITASDEEIEAHLREANLPTLVLSLVHLTGDAGLLSRFAPRSAGDIFDISGGYDEATAAEIRQFALRVLRDLRDGRRQALPPSKVPLDAMASFLAGRPLNEKYLALMHGEMDSPSPAPPATPAPGYEGFTVAVIGGGMSGILAAIRLKEAGIPFVVLEKDSHIGGTWYENSYPGAGVDVESHLYCYTFAPKNDWPDYFSKQPELFKYWAECAERFGIMPHVRLNTRCDEARWDEAAAQWRLSIVGSDGQSEELRVNAVIAATGHLNTPSIPAITGRETFKGAAFHTAQWDHSVSLEGKAVAMIGNGASAMQVGPTIAGNVKTLTVFQKEPHWALFNPRYHNAMTPAKTWLLDHVPYYQSWYWFLLFWRTSDGLHESLQIDASWPHQDRSISQLNDHIREQLTGYITSKIPAERQDLLDKVLPKYPPFGKRILIDNGWYAMAQRENVELVDDPIVALDETGVVTANGYYPADVIVFATGFQPLKIRMKVVGRGGRSLDDIWGDNPSDPRAYLGITVPDLPNFFMLYGPNTNVGSSATVTFNSETQVHYVLECLTVMRTAGIAALSVRPDVHDAYNDRADAELAKMVWNSPALKHTWYRSGKNGRIATNLPFSVIEYWWLTRHANLDDFELIHVPKPQPAVSEGA
jgi:4-hydroxyacetophenone monooxygenase